MTESPDTYTSMTDVKVAAGLDDGWRNVVVVGGGFAGTEIVRVLQRRLPRGYRLVLISEQSYTTFTPLLPEAMGATIFPEQAVAPLREVLDVRRGSRFVMGDVQALEPSAQRLLCRSLVGLVAIPYDQLILAFGSRARLDLIPGMAEHAETLKTVGDAMEIRNQVLRRLAQIELEKDATRRTALGHFVVIGGGFSGVEVAGQLADYLLDIRRYYPDTAGVPLRVTMLQDIDCLLPELPASLGTAAERSLRARGVGIRLGARAAEIGANGVRLADGEWLQACTVISTIGTRPAPLAQTLATALDLTLDHGRIPVAPDLSLPGRPGLWALGDCARVPNAHDPGQPSPPTAQFAVRQAWQLASNLLRRLEGRPTQPFSDRARGMMAAVGHRRGVALVWGLSLSGLPAWLLWRAYYLWQMPTPGRKLRIFVEWTWGMFFPADITHLYFLRSKEEVHPEKLD